MLALNKKEQAYILNRVNGDSPAVAYRNAGYDVESVNNLTAAIAAKERKVMQSQFVKAVAQKHGLTIDVFMLKLAEILDACTQKEYLDDGVLIQGEVRPDYRTRLRALDLVGKMLNITKSEEENSADRITNTINILAINDRFSNKTPEELLKAMQNLKMGRSVNNEHTVIIPSLELVEL